MTDTTSIFESPVGPLRAVASDCQLVELSFHTGPRAAVRTDTSPDDGNNRVLHATEVQLAEYFALKRTQFDVPMSLQGPAFYRQVWEALCEIPYGQTISYGVLAARLGVPESARAVGAANGANPIAIIIPCHRVIGADGSLVGYGGGLKRKQLLLDLESNAIRLAFEPAR